MSQGQRTREIILLRSSVSKESIEVCGDERMKMTVMQSFGELAILSSCVFFSFLERDGFW